MPDVSHNFQSGGWQFTAEVAAVFDQHVAANVPNYHLIQDMVAHLSDWLAPDGAVIADMGASTGTTVKAISDRHPGRALDFHLYDSELPMLEQAYAKLEAHPIAHEMAYHHLDVLQDLPRHEDADLTLALFFLQFLPMYARGPVLEALADAAKHDGYLVIAEKVEQPTAFWQEVANEATWDYKAANGIDADTIRTKARALRGVLQPMQSSDLVQLIADSGWERPTPIYRWHCWGIWAAKARRHA